MKLRPSAALLAVTAAVSLAACGGGSTATIANVAGNQAQLRVVNGVPGVGPLDVYLQTTGSTSPSNPIIGALAYATASDFLAEPAAAATLLAQSAGGQSPGAGGHPVVTCTLPQLGINAKYSIVLVNVGGALNCELFQDFDYNGAPQYRAHDASPNSALAGGAGFGTIAAPSAPPGTPFTPQVAGPQGTLAFTAGGSATGFTAAQPVTISQFSGSISFAVGSSSSGSQPALATLDSRYIFGPNGTTQPNSGGGLNASGSAGTSIFAIDCTGAVASNVPCTNGIALVGYTDRL